MPKSSPPYPSVFRVEAFRLVRSGGRPLREVAANLGVADQTLRRCGTSPTSLASPCWRWPWLPRRSAPLGTVKDRSVRSASCRNNPFSEAQFKTLKYCTAFPERFGSIADAQAFCERFFSHYNHEHRHSGIGFHTPASVHYGTATEVRAERSRTLDAAYAGNPQRFGHRRPSPPKLPSVAWINELSDETITTK